MTTGSQSNESMSTMRDRAHNIAGKVVDKVQETAGRVTGTGQESPPVMEQAAEQVTSRMDMGKDYVAEAVTGVARALRQTSQHLREEGAQPMLGTYADRGAEQIERFGGYLRKRDSEQLVTDIEGFARRKPLAFAGSAFALGMLAVRFLRSGSQSQHQASSFTPAAGYGTAGRTPSYGTAGSTSPLAGRTASGTIPPPTTGGAGIGTQTGAGTRTTPGTTPGTGVGSGGVQPARPTQTGAGTGTGAATPAGTTGTTGTPSEPTMPRPAAAPSTGGTPAAPRTSPPTPGTSSQSGRSPLPSERPQTGNRNQP
jgi:uncharacterized protein YjbJ (UPF0337 family)